jgi:hypothetical protein
MPEFTIKEVRLPELHLPEIKRDEIVRTLSGVHLPEVDLAKARRATLKVPAVTLSADDVGKVLAAGAAITRFVRPAPARIRAPRNLFGRRSRNPVALIVRPKTRRSRTPILLGAIAIAALAVWAILRRPAARQRLETASQDARERVATWRARDLRPNLESIEGGTAPVDEISSDVQNVTGPTDDAVTEDTGTDLAPAFEESPARG